MLQNSDVMGCKGIKPQLPRCRAAQLTVLSSAPVSRL